MRVRATQARAGFGHDTQGELLFIKAAAQVVCAFEDGPQLLVTNFAHGTGPNATFARDTAANNWVERGVSANIGMGS